MYTHPDPENRGQGRSAGSALIVVLWVVGLLSLMIGTFVFEAHMEAKITSYYRKRSQAESLARSGAEVAQMLLSRSSELKGKARLTPEQRDPTDRWYDAARTLADGLNVSGVNEKVGEGLVTVDIIPEPARRNINLLGKNDLEREETLERILKVGDVPEDMWPVLVESLLDWMDGDDKPRPSGAETDDYYGLLPEPRKARNGRLESVEELLLVKGYTRTILYGGVISTGRQGEAAVVISGIADLLTTFGDDGKVNVNAASKRVLLTLPGVDDLVADAIIEEREGRAREGSKPEDSSFRNVQDFVSRIPGLPPNMGSLVTTDSAIYRVTSVGTMKNVNARVVSTVHYSPGNMKILTWLEEN